MDNQTVIQTIDLTRYFGTFRAVDHVSLSIPKGCICGLLGRNGAGKTTIIKMLLGLLPPTTGSSAVLGCDSTAITPAIRQRVGYVTEGHHLYRYMSIDQLRNFQKPFFPDQWDNDLFNEMIEYFDLPRKKKVKNFSNGQRAQVSLALAIAPNPELLIMDDPTLGLDAAIRRQFLEGMIHLIQSRGKTILFSSHILSDVERVSDRIIVIDKGAVRADCTLDQFQNSIRKTAIKFPAKPPSVDTLQGLLHQRADSNQLEIVTVGASENQIEAWAKQNNASVVKFIPMNLEDTFIEYTQPKSGKKLFQWEKI
ncbi:MAG: ABC transporter ATP-binding protein [Anaerohalosphaera sp.]|nr:ABC transporter ATP-binding protein [Anaerohalosphaera sp.]